MSDKLANSLTIRQTRKAEQYFDVCIVEEVNAITIIKQINKHEINKRLK